MDSRDHYRETVDVRVRDGDVDRERNSVPSEPSPASALADPKPNWSKVRPLVKAQYDRSAAGVIREGAECGGEGLRQSACGGLDFHLGVVATRNAEATDQLAYVLVHRSNVTNRRLRFRGSGYISGYISGCRCQAA